MAKLKSTLQVSSEKGRWSARSTHLTITHIGRAHQLVKAGVKKKRSKKEMAELGEIEQKLKQVGG